MISNFVIEITILISIATVFAIFLKLFKQPLLIGYILTGILLGPAGFRIIKNSELIYTLSIFGISLLLFTIGIELDIKKLKNLGVRITLISIAEVLGVTGISFFVIYFFEKNIYSALILGFLLSFSSTMVVIKILSDKREVNTLHGRIVFGILLIQDVIAIALLSVLSSHGYYMSAVVNALLKGIGIFVLAIVSGYFIFPTLFKFISESQELLLIASLTICFLFSSVAYTAGFSIAIGAFAAGVSLASMPYSTEIIGKVRSLKEFFAIIFFISLGMSFYPEKNIALIAALLAIVIFVKPLLIFVFNSMAGFEKRTSFITSISLGQVSEFSLIFASEAFILGVVPHSILSIVIILTTLSIITTGYSMKFSKKLYNKFSKFLEFSRRLNLSEYREKSSKKTTLENHMILCGCDCMGKEILQSLRKNKRKFIVIDFNPDIIAFLKNQNVNCIYGDATDEEILERANVKSAKMIISTIPSEEDNAQILWYASHENKNIKKIVTANSLNSIISLYRKGADYVIWPEYLSGEKVNNIMNELAKKQTTLEKIREKHLNKIIERNKEEMINKYRLSVKRLLNRLGKKIK